MSFKIKLKSSLFVNSKFDIYFHGRDLKRNALEHVKTYYLRDFEDCTYMYYERQPPWWRLLVHIILCDEIRIFIILFPRSSKSPRFCHACFFSSHTKQICFILYFVEVIDEPQISIDFFSTNSIFICLSVNI